MVYLLYFPTLLTETLTGSKAFVDVCYPIPIYPPFPICMWTGILLGKGATLLLPFNAGGLVAPFRSIFTLLSSVTTVEWEPVDPLLLEAGLVSTSFFLQALMSRIVVMIRTNIRMRIMATATAIKYSNFSWKCKFNGAHVNGCLVDGTWTSFSTVSQNNQEKTTLWIFMLGDIFHSHPLNNPQFANSLWRLSQLYLEREIWVNFF